MNDYKTIIENLTYDIEIIDVYITQLESTLESKTMHSSLLVSLKKEADSIKRLKEVYVQLKAREDKKEEV